MRILYIHNINQVAKTFAHELSQRGHTTDVYEPDLRGAGSSLPIKLLLLPLRILNMRHALSNLHMAHFDLVHIHWASYGVFALLSKIPVVLHCHGSDVRKRLCHPFFRPLLTTILRQATAVLCITPDLLPIVRTVRPDAYFSPAPVDTVHFAPDDRQTEPESHAWTILLFARLDAEKGSFIAIEGITRFTQRHAGIRVLLLDWGPLRKKYKELYAQQFEFVPLVPPNQVPQLILSAHAIVGQFVLGSLGLSELQAMSCAKPVICSFLYNEAYPSPPPLCQASTAEAIDDHLERLFQHPEIGTELGKQAREWVISYHSNKVLSDTLETLYCSILQHADTKKD
ncbi:glycosyltransferase [Dictyobacter formicarum]|uniref:Glycosyltransferase subfamily 4-like N-terminal domain-containing protein n=1 Tax=Dictyobacter formicarum TaxID=2778368 RepID=A0ABQ3VAD0_9CHLR|nr:glycosyltransferase [Dictyobacter formicarum]GHO82740.1 hypothetical protein KSZ_07460 [Dictyobacter formicarum]